MASTLPATPFKGLWIPLVTPFDAHGAIDHAALATLVRDMGRRGVSGFIACGTTAEAPALEDAEQDAVLDTVLAHAQGLPVVMGLSGYRLPQVLARVREWNQRPIAGLLVPAPHYIRPSQGGLQHWFEAIANASAHPLIVYDIPARTGAMVALDTLRALARHPRIRAIKDCGGDAAKTLALIHDGQLQVLAGEDTQILSTLAQGGHGAIAASAHWQPERFVELMTRVQSGDLARAQALWALLLPVVQACFEEPNPAPVKALLAQQGALRPTLRAPMEAASSALAQRLAALVNAQEAALSRL
jgi:4-hydroxy-tetrahydrodipicolinate synthase